MIKLNKIYVKMNKYATILVLIIVIIIIFLIFASQGTTSADNVPSKILYSYGLFSDDPMNQDMKSTIEVNGQKTNMPYMVLGKDEVTEDLEKIEKIIPGITETYKKIPRGVAKSDLARLAHLYIRGGHYADLDVEFNERPTVSSDTVLLYTENFIPWELGFGIANYAISSPKEHPFILEAMKVAKKRVDESFTHYSIVSWDDATVIRCTGPGMLTDVYRKWKNGKVGRVGLYKSHKILKHKAAGTWRNKKDSN